MEEKTLPTPKYSQKIKIMKNVKQIEKKKQMTKKYMDEHYDKSFLNSYFSHIKMKINID